MALVPPPLLRECPLLPRPWMDRGTCAAQRRQLPAPINSFGKFLIRPNPQKALTHGRIASTNVGPLAERKGLESLAPLRVRRFLRPLS